MAASLAAQDQKRGPSTPEEREQAVKFTHFLEREPLHKDAQVAVRWLLVFFIQVPDISVKACTEFLPTIGKKEAKKKRLNGLFGQMIFSQGAFIIENPEKSKSDHAVYLAGLEGVLRSYESVVREKPKSRHKELDALVKMRDSDELGSYVMEKMEGCGS